MINHITDIKHAIIKRGIINYNNDNLNIGIVTILDNELIINYRYNINKNECFIGTYISKIGV